MKKPIISLLLAASSLLPMASGLASDAVRPDTVAIFKQNQVFAYLYKMENVTDGSVRYRIELCELDGCDFIAYSRDLTALADYAYLYLIYGEEGGYVQRDKPSAADVVKEAKDKKLDRALLDIYAPRMHCQDDKDQPDCVMKGLVRAAGIARYTSKFDEGQDSYDLIRD